MSSYKYVTADVEVDLGEWDDDELIEEIKARGGKVVREAGPMKGGVTVIAFVEDPDGYKVELIQQDANATNN